LGRFAGWYSVRDEAFYSENELVDGRAPTGADVEWLEEENYFFRLSAWQDRLLEFYERNPDAVAPRGRRNEVISNMSSTYGSMRSPTTLPRLAIRKLKAPISQLFGLPTCIWSARISCASI